MSIVIIGGNDRMVSKYTNLCKEHNCKAKVFTQPDSNLRNKIGTPDLMVLFTNTVCHKMITTAVQQAQKHNIKVLRSHSSSASALKALLSENV
ncbi:MAG: DUF2325 domain-containing protein [Lachnospirales bacterium]